MAKFYVRIKGVLFSAEGQKRHPKGWNLACEHTAFKGVCTTCAFSVLNKFPQDDDKIVILQHCFSKRYGGYNNCISCDDAEKCKEIMGDAGI